MSAFAQLRGAEGYGLAVMRALGKEAEAEKLLAAYNKFNVAFGGRPFAMPEPAGSINGLVTCPASFPINRKDAA